MVLIMLRVKLGIYLLMNMGQAAIAEVQAAWKPISAIIKSLERRGKSLSVIFHWKN